MRRSAAHACLFALPFSSALAAALVSVLAIFLPGGLAGCKDGAEPRRPVEPTVGTNSNWLLACSADDECGDAPLCECGACTQRCASDLDCDGLVGARCIAEASPSVSQSCGDTSGPGAGTVDASAADPATRPSLCLPRCEAGTCRDGQACVGGGCVLAALPDNAFCAPVAEASVIDRTREDDLLAQISALRAAGGTACGTAGAALPAATLRLDARLTCAARVLAADIAETRAISVTDSQGRGTRTRIVTTGYAPVRWGDTFAIEVSIAARALELMLADPAGCAALTGENFSDVGIGSARDVMVVTFGAP